MTTWQEILLADRAADDAWRLTFTKMAEVCRSTASPVDLHNKTIEPDRLLAESAWDLWQQYPAAAPRTATALRDWWTTTGTSGQHGRAVLILDALSLREMFVLLAAAEARHVHPTRIEVTGSEVPSDTNAFAQALGLPGRASLANNRAPRSFCFSGDAPWTDVLSLPFEDAARAVPPERDVLVWHSWLDDLLHVHERSPDNVYRAAAQGLQADGFWRFIDALRTGRRLVVTADHGYAVARLFTTNENDPEVVAALRDTFGASRCKPADQPWTHALMPPVVFTHNGQHVIMGQRKWTVQGGFPFLCHGGMSLLEVAVPFIEFPSL